MPPAKLLTRFPFKTLTGGIMILQATVDGFKDSLNFVLDTGSGGISLDSTTVSELKLVSKKTDRTIRGIAGMKEVSFTFSHALHLPGLTIDSMDFHINDYEILTSVYGVRIDGIIGYSFFRRFIISIDYDTHMIEVFSPGSIKYPKGGFYIKPNFTTLPMHTIPVRDATQVTARYYFDTGAGLCMLFSRSFIQDSMFFTKKKKIFHTQGEGLGGRAPMDITVIREVKVGPYHFRKVPVYIFDDEYNVTAYPLLGGLVGNDILRRFNTIFNYPDQVFYLRPNTAFSETFDYSYTGLAIYLINGDVVVLDVLPGSPAEKAGFKPFDKIISIENNLSGDIQVYKTFLQNAGAKLRVIIKRDGELMPMRLPVKDIR